MKISELFKKTIKQYKFQGLKVCTLNFGKIVNLVTRAFQLFGFVFYLNKRPVELICYQKP